MRTDQEVINGIQWGYILSALSVNPGTSPGLRAWVEEYREPLTTPEMKTDMLQELKADDLLREEVEEFIANNPDVWTLPPKSIAAIRKIAARMRGEVPALVN